MATVDPRASYPLKRPIDLLLSLLGGIVLAPLLAVTSLLVLFFHGRPVLYAQTRPGLHGKPFRMYKFRSMTNARDATGELLPDEQRLTAFGRLLRASSIDELPELYNVVRGEMSLIGPRPLLMQYLPLYTSEQMRRHDVRPGITGWAQINGRNNVSWREKFDLDIWYIENISLKLDIHILFKTLSNVIFRKNIRQPGDKGMEYFTG